MKGLHLVVILVCACVFVRADEEECDYCEEQNCPSPVGCVAGIAKDRCGCCDVCAKAEYELCDHPRVRSEVQLGQCGDQLQCRLRNDLSEDDGPEAICFCLIEGELCGSDNITYENLCQLMAAGVRKGEKVKVGAKGPCKTAPIIVGPPENTKNTTGTDMALICEAQGFPIPAIEWTWTRVDGKTVSLPSDDLHISVNMRGGPEKWQVTGWLQIMDVKKDHEGDYTCIAQNEFGITQHSARVNVVLDEEREKKHKKHFRRNQKARQHGNDL